MKRFICSDSLGSLLYPPPEKTNQKESCAYSREFQKMLEGLDDEDSVEEEFGQSMEKKRRLSIDQVKALEKIFEVDNRLDPERKVKVAQELGLQSRQVSIWFQNRRARWKNKQLERDYNHLKANYEALKHNFNKLEQERYALMSELRELRGKFPDKKKESNQSDKGKALFLGSQNNAKEQDKDTPIEPELYENEGLLVGSKDGLSDSDSSGMLNEDINFNSGLLISPASSSPGFNFSSSLCSSSSANYSQYLDSRAVLAKAYQQQLLTMEDAAAGIFTSDESCNIFSVDQAPTLCWYQGY